jgi:hypothetical protein
MIRVFERILRWAVLAVRVVFYVAFAVTVLVGLPWAMMRFVGWPLPRGVPSGAIVQDWVDHPMTGMRFWKGVSILGWIVWTLLIVLILWVLLSPITRVRVPRLRIRPLQGFAAGMVGATAATMTAGAGHAAPPAAVAPATVSTLDQATHDVGDGVYVVERGDWASSVADRFLGDPHASPRIVDLNPRLKLRGPSHLEPGWRLRLPADAYDRGLRLHAAGHWHPRTPHPDLAHSRSDPEPPKADTPPPPPTQPAAVPQRDATAATGPSQHPSQPAPSPDELDGDGEGHPDVVVAPSTTGAMAGAGLLASLLFALLTAERRRQRGLYAVGQQPPQPANGRAEREFRAAQQPADVERLDVALRSLSNGLAHRSAVPDIVGVRLMGADIQVLLGQPDDDPPPPWLDEGTHWALPAYLEPDVAGYPVTLLPTLVTVGSRAGRHLLIDLERLGTLSIGGHPYRSRDLLRHIVCELACNTWSDNATIIVAGFGGEADTFTEIGPHRVVTAESPGAAITRVRAELTQRAAGDAATSPTVLIVAEPDAATRSALADLHQALAQVGRCGIAVVATVPDADPIGTALLTISDTGVLKAELPGLRLATDAATVPIDMLDPMAAVFRAAHLLPAALKASPAEEVPAWDDTVDPADGVLGVFEPSVEETPPTTPSVRVVELGPAGAGPAVSFDPDSLDDDVAAWRNKAPSVPRVSVLGPIEVDMPGQLNDSRRRLYTEILLYLLTRRERSADKASIENALWYGNPAGETTLRKCMYKLRQWLGPRADGKEWIPERDGDGVYRLEPGMILDVQLMMRLRNRGNTRGADGIADHQAALELVRGAPMRSVRDSGHYRRPFTWIPNSELDPTVIVPAIADLAHHVAQHYLNVGDTATARWAIDQAWLADPDRGFDDLWHDRMHVEHQAGRTAALNQIVEAYREHCEVDVLEELPTPVYNRIRALLAAD